MKMITQENVCALQEDSKSWQSSLEFLWLEITGKCNLECVHCYAESGPTIPLVGQMKFSDWVSVLEQGFALGCRKMQFIGGEPTLHPQFLELVKRAKAIGYEFVEVYTNGTTLNDELLGRFCEYGVHVAFSFYSRNAKAHDAVTKRQGSQTRTLKNIKRAVELSIPVRVGVIEIDADSQEVEATLEYLREIGIENPSADRMRNFGRASLIVPTEDKYNELCGACWKGQLTIDPAGMVYPCVFSKFHPVGHIQEGLEALLQKQTLHEFREKVRGIDESRPVVAGCGPDRCNPYCKPNCNPYRNCNPKCLPW